MISVSGMHKKSIEASATLKDDDGNDDAHSDVSTPLKDKNELKTESIASLRAKAQEFQVKLSMNEYSCTDQSSHAPHHTAYVNDAKQLPALNHDVLNHTLPMDPRLNSGYLNSVS